MEDESGVRVQVDAVNTAGIKKPACGWLFIDLGI
jgi:hypothetical protein